MLTPSPTCDDSFGQLSCTNAAWAQENAQHSKADVALVIIVSLPSIGFIVMIIGCFLYYRRKQKKIMKDLRW